MAALLRDSEAPCEEEAPLVVEAPSRSRLAWKIAAAAAGAALVAVAGVSWKSGPAAGLSLTGLADEPPVFPPKFSVYRTMGCKNWESISHFNATVTDEVACRTLCDGDTKCVSYNYQETACQKGWAVAGGCMLFNGTCDNEGNGCWALGYKLYYTLPEDA